MQCETACTMRYSLVSEGKLSVMHSLRLKRRNFVSKFFSSPQMHARWQHQGGGVVTFTFWCWVQICGQKFFPFTKCSGLRIFSKWGGGGGCHFYFLMLSPNLWSKIFPFTKRSGLRIFSKIGGGGVVTFTFWCWVQICGQKFFPLPSALDLEFSQGRGGGVVTFTFWCWVQICGQNFFPFTKRSELRIFSGWALDLEMGTFGNYSLTVAVNVSLAVVMQLLFFMEKLDA